MTRFLTVEQAATRVGKSVRTIGRWVDGGLKVRVGLIREDELLETDLLMRGRRGRPRAKATSIFVLDAAHLTRQREFSERTFGPGSRVAGVLDHIRKELDEVRAEPDDLSEWADLVILAFDGALRQGADPQAILDAIEAKQSRNEAREWPDWRTQPLDRARPLIEIEVIELGEDSDAWFVTGVTGKGQANRCENAKAAVDAWLVECLAGDDSDALANARENLAGAKARPFIGWFATGHREGELVDYRKVEPPRGLVGVLIR